MLNNFFRMNDECYDFTINDLMCILLSIYPLDMPISINAQDIDFNGRQHVSMGPIKIVDRAKYVNKNLINLVIEIEVLVDKD